MKSREWLSSEEDSLSCIRTIVEKHEKPNFFAIEDSNEKEVEYIADFWICDEGERFVNFRYEIGSLREKYKAIHEIRKLKKAINDFYNIIREIPDSEFIQNNKEEVECSDVSTVEEQ